MPEADPALREVWNSMLPKSMPFNSTHSSASEVLLRMFFAILRHSLPYFDASSEIACSERAKNSSIILLSSNSVILLSTVYYG